jgi:hypothetical protein
MIAAPRTDTLTLTTLQAFKSNFPLDALICNAATYQPATPEPRYTVDGIEESLQINHLSHFLLCSLLIDDMKKSSDPRMIVVSTCFPEQFSLTSPEILRVAQEERKTRGYGRAADVMQNHLRRCSAGWVLGHVFW